MANRRTSKEDEQNYDENDKAHDERTKASFIVVSRIGIRFVNCGMTETAAWQADCRSGFTPANAYARTTRSDRRAHAGFAQIDGNPRGDFDTFLKTEGHYFFFVAALFGFALALPDRVFPPMYRPPLPLDPCPPTRELPLRAALAGVAGPCGLICDWLVSMSSAMSASIICGSPQYEIYAARAFGVPSVSS